MIIIGCDYHPGFQQIAFVDTETGELQECRLQHREGSCWGFLERCNCPRTKRNCALSCVSIPRPL
jgi:transposase